MFKITRSFTLVSLLMAAFTASAQIAPGRTWPELKEAVTERVKAQRYPLNGFDAGEVAQILSRISSLDRDEWARSWMQSGDRMFKAGQDAEATDRANRARSVLRQQEQAAG